MLQAHSWECTICDDGRVYKKYSSVERHCLEQHSGYGFKCRACARVFGRVDAKHQNCPNGQLPEGKYLVNRINGTSGAQAYDGREAYRMTLKDLVKRILVQQPTPATRGGQLQKNRSRAPRSRSPLRPLSENARSERRSSSPSKRMPRQRQRQSSSPVERRVTTATTDLKKTPSPRKARSPSPALSSSSSSSSGTTTLSMDGGVEATIFNVGERVAQLRGDIRVSLTTSIFIDRDGTHMRVILNYLRDHKCSTVLLPRDKRNLHEIKVEAIYYNLSGLVDVVDSKIKSLD